MVRNLLQWGSDWLQTQILTHGSGRVVYHRGGDSVEVTATIGRTEFEIESEFGVHEKVESRDFLVPAAELVLAGAWTLPKRGDLIHETMGTTVFVYEVMAPGKEPHFRYSDAFRRPLRIHTRQVAESAV